MITKIFKSNNTKERKGFMKKLTINKALLFLQDLQDNGCGNYEIHFQDRPIFKDEWTVNHCDEVLEIYRRIYNDEEKKIINTLTDKITEAVEEYREKMSKLNERR